MTTNNTSRVVTALFTAAVIFLIAVVLPKFLFSDLLTKLMTTQGLELALALLAIAILGKGKFADYGFCRPGANPQAGQSKPRWIPIMLAAPLLGMAATPLILGLGGNGNPLAKSLSFPQIVLFVWIFSSII